MSTPASSPPPPSLDLTGKTVFYVEDDTELRDMMVMWFQLHGATVYAEPTVPSALLRLAYLSKEVDVVVTDWNVFQRKGKEVVDLAEALDIPVLVFSGTVDEPRSQVSCPVVGKGSMDQLRRALRSLLREGEEGAS